MLSGVGRQRATKCEVKPEWLVIPAGWPVYRIAAVSVLLLFFWRERRITVQNMSVHRIFRVAVVAAARRSLQKNTRRRGDGGWRFYKQATPGGVTKRDLPFVSIVGRQTHTPL